MGSLLCVLGVLGAFGGERSPLLAQPDPRMMAGIPRPVDDLPNGSISVRVIRGALTNNIPNQPVELHIGSDVLTVSTDSEGRAQFDKLAAGAAVRAVTFVDGQRLESEVFPVPAQGGIRLLLVAEGDGGGPSPVMPPISGQLAIGGQSRIIIQPGDESVTMYYLLEIVNGSTSPVTPQTPFAFDMPPGAVGTTIMQGSTALATVDGRRVSVGGPVPAGNSLLYVGTQIPQTSGTFDLEQRFPAPVNQFALIVQKLGDTRVSSPQLAEQREVTQQGETYIAGPGTPVAAGEPLRIAVTGIPHYSATPRRVALLLSAGILVAGLWVGWRRMDPARDRDERKRLIARRDKLLGELVRLERDERGSPRYPGRREELMRALEGIYGALDSDGAAPGSGNPAGATA